MLHPARRTRFFAFLKRREDGVSVTLYRVIMEHFTISASALPTITFHRFVSYSVRVLA